MRIWPLLYVCILHCIPKRYMYLLQKLLTIYHTKYDMYGLLQSLGISLFGCFTVHPVFVVKAVYNKIQRCMKPSWSRITYH